MNLEFLHFSVLHLVLQNFRAVIILLFVHLITTVPSNNIAGNGETELYNCYCIINLSCERKDWNFRDIKRNIASQTIFQRKENLAIRKHFFLSYFVL